MGNNIGIQINSQKVKIVYQQSKLEDIQFMRNLNSQFLRNIIVDGNIHYFMFSCTHEQFQAYSQHKNVELLRQNYKETLSVQQLVVFTNYQTMNYLQKNLHMKQALKAIVKNNKIIFKHRTKSQTSLEALKFYARNKMFLSIQTIYSLIQLDKIIPGAPMQQFQMGSLPNRVLIMTLRNGLSMFQVDLQKKSVEKLMGSIIGETTIISLLKNIFPNKRLEEIIQQSVAKGQFAANDLLVQDIYGINLHNLGLPNKIIASSLGKLAKGQKVIDMNSEKFKLDIVKSLTVSFCINNANLLALAMCKYNFQTAIVIDDKLIHKCYRCLTSSIFDAYIPKIPKRKIYFAKESSFLTCLGCINLQ